MNVFSKVRFVRFLDSKSARFLQTKPNYYDIKMGCDLKLVN